MFDTNTKQRQNFLRSIGRKTNDNLLCIGCGIVFAALCVAFFI